MECPKDIEKHNSLVQEERVYNFLGGLDDHLDSIRAEVLRIEPFPYIEEAFARVRQEDVRQNYHLKKGENNTPVAMVAKENEANLIPARIRQPKPRPPPGGCTHYGGLKHTKETCFKLHGYPDWWKDPKKKKQQGNDTSKATIVSGSEVSLVPLINGEKASSIEGNFFYKSDKWAGINSKNWTEYITEKTNKLGHLVSAAMIYAGLVSEIPEPDQNLGRTGSVFSTSRSSKEAWIIDSGASDHMTFCKNDITDNIESRK
jgi:hypothetical protein